MRKPLLSALLVLSLAALARADDPPAESADQMMRRAAYYETQKHDPTKAIATYEQIATSFPDSKDALRAVERVAVLNDLAGDVEQGERARTRAAALRTKLGVETPPPPPADDGSRGGRSREKIKEKLKERLGRGDGPKPPLPPDAPRPPHPPGKPRERVEPLPPAVQHLIEEWKAQGLSREEIRKRIGDAVKRLEKSGRRKGDHPLGPPPGDPSAGPPPEPPQGPPPDAPAKPKHKHHKRRDI